MWYVVVQIFVGAILVTLFALLYLVVCMGKEDRR